MTDAELHALLLSPPTQEKLKQVLPHLLARFPVYLKMREALERMLDDGAYISTESVRVGMSALAAAEEVDR